MKDSSSHGSLGWPAKLAALPLLAAACLGLLAPPATASVTWTNSTTANGLGADYMNGVYASRGTIYAATGNGVSIGVTASAVPGTGLAGLAMLGFAGVTRRRR